MFSVINYWLSSSFFFVVRCEWKISKSLLFCWFLIRFNKLCVNSVGRIWRWCECWESCEPSICLFVVSPPSDGVKVLLTWSTCYPDPLFTTRNPQQMIFRTSISFAPSTSHSDATGNVHYSLCPPREKIRHSALDQWLQLFIISFAFFPLLIFTSMKKFKVKLRN